MAADNSNIFRADMDDIFDSVKRRTYYKCKARDLDSDKYAISGEDTEVLYEFVTEAAEIIANKANYIKYHTESGYDAITYNTEYEMEDDDQDDKFEFEHDTDADGFMTTPQTGLSSVQPNNTIKTKDVMYQDDNSPTIGDRKRGEKLTSTSGDIISFQIDDLLSSQRRYTVVQGFIRSALINYSLYKWYALMGLGDDAGVELAEFNLAVDRVRYNAVGNHRNKKISRKYRLF